ncbi:MAG: hypothetical protein WB797_11075 [Nocardioides sp.]
MTDGPAEPDDEDSWIILPNGSKPMMNNLMNDDLARAQLHARLGEAEQVRRGRRHVAARRLSRKAEEAARQAHLTLARSL